MEIDYAYRIGSEDPQVFLPWQSDWIEESAKHRYNAAGPGKGGGKTRVNGLIVGEEGLFNHPVGLKVAVLHERSEEHTSELQSQR